MPLLGIARTPAIPWQDCPDYTDAFPELTNRLQCATIEVPKDHAAPAEGVIKIALMRVSARDPQKRRGVLFINPGGPGIPAGFYTASLVADWEWEGSSSPEKRRISEQFDLIGMTPRGIKGSDDSTALLCQSDEWLQPYDNITDNRSPANILALNEHAQVSARGCQSNPLAPYITSEQTAHDMDLVRQLLGEEKISYWGVSYGTELGAWYGGMFPQHVDRMILDSNVDWTRDLYENALPKASSRQEIFERFVVDKILSAPENYSLGATGDEIQQRFIALDSRFREIVRKSTGSPEAMMAAAFFQEQFRQQPRLQLEQLLDTIRTHDFSADQMVDQEARTLARLFAPGLFTPPEQPSRLDMNNASSVLWTVQCQNTSPIPSPSEWAQWGTAFAHQFPVGGSDETYPLCAYWRQLSPPRPPIERLSQIENLVLIQAEFDAFTPRQGAMRAFSQVPSASMIYARGLVAHGFAYNLVSSCVNRAAGAFMAEGVKPSRLLECVDATGFAPTLMESMEADRANRRGSF
ncbi:alpha/beta hydrolase [Dyella sp. GSA-30]|nr:alpha/beta hydrolase [Dyella sp. GSA-30]